jgi:hypothetical protein
MGAMKEIVNGWQSPRILVAAWLLLLVPTVFVAVDQVTHSGGWSLVLFPCIALIVGAASAPLLPVPLSRIRVGIAAGLAVIAAYLGWAISF